MPGTDTVTGSLFSYVDLEGRMPVRHPLRAIRWGVKDALASLDWEFDALFASCDCRSIPPERLIRTSLLQGLHSVRSERQLDGADGRQSAVPPVRRAGDRRPVWIPTVFTKTRDWLLTTEMSRKVMAAILAHRELALLLSDKPFRSTASWCGVPRLK